MNEREEIVGKHSIVRDDVVIGKNSKIWHFCNLYGCKIGENTQIGSYCEIKEGVEIGDNCRLQSYIFISEKTKIGNNVFIGPKVNFMNDKYPTTKKTIEKTWILKPVVVEDDVSIGGNVTILPGIRIGKGSFIGAGSVVTKNVPPYAVVVGNPARVIGSVKDDKYKNLI